MIQSRFKKNSQLLSVVLESYDDIRSVSRVKNDLLDRETKLFQGYFDRNSVLDVEGMLRCYLLKYADMTRDVGRLPISSQYHLLF